MLTTVLLLIAVGGVLLWTFLQESGKSTTEKSLTDEFEEV